MRPRAARRGDVAAANGAAGTTTSAATSDPQATQGPGRRATAKRISWGLVDQLLSSGSNVIGTIVAARYLSAGDFGAFSLAIVSYTMISGISRSLCSEALLVRPGADEAGRTARTREATAAAGLVGLVAAAVLLAASVPASGAVATCLAVLAVTIPGLLVQDTCRYASFAHDDPRTAARSDLSWVVLQLVLFAVLVLTGMDTAGWILAAWAGSGVVAGLVVLSRCGGLPAFDRGFAWIVANRDLSLRYVLDFFTAAGAAQVGTYTLGATSGVRGVGSIRGAQTLFGPLNVLFRGAYIALVPEGRRAAERSARSVERVALVASAAFASVSLGLTVFFLWLPESVGEQVLGSTWSSAHDVLLPVGLAAIVSGAMAGPLAGLRSLADAKRLLQIRLWALPTTLLFPVAGAVVWDAVGLAWGITAAQVVAATLYWNGFRQATRELGTSPALRVDGEAVETVWRGHRLREVTVPVGSPDLP